MAHVSRRQFLAFSAPLGAVLAWPTLLVAKNPLPVKVGVDLKTITTPPFPDLPKGALKRLGSSVMRVPGSISAIRFSQNSDIILAAETDELRGWNPATGKLVFRYSYPQGISAQAGILNTKGGLSVLGRPDGGGKYELHQYSLKDGKILKRSEQIGIDTNDHTDFTLDGTLCVILHGHQVRVFDAFSGEQQWTVELPNEQVGGCRFFADGSVLAIAKKGEIKLFDAKTGKEMPALKLGDFKHEDKNGWDWLTSPIVSSDGAWLAAVVGENEAGVGVWDVKAKKFVRLVAPATAPEGFRLGNDRALVVTSVPGRFTYWDIKTGKKDTDISVPTGSEVLLSPDGQWIASEAQDAVILYNAVTGKLVPHSSDPPGRPTHLWFTTPTQLVGQLPEYGGWVQWDTTTGNEQLRRAKDVDGCRSVMLSTDGRVGLHLKKELYIAQELTTGKTLFEHKLVVNEARSRRGEAVNMTLAAAGTFVAFSAASGLELVTLVDKQHTTIPHKAAETPLEGVIVRLAGNIATVATMQEEVNFVDVYDMAAKRHVRRISVGGEVLATSLSGDGRMLAVAYFEQDNERGRQLVTVVQRTLDTGDVFRVAEKNHSEAAISLSPDGRLLARVEQDDKVNVYEVGVGLRQTLPTGKSPNALAIAPDGRLLATSQQGGPVVLWELYPKWPAPTPARKDLDNIWRLLNEDNAMRVHADLCILIQNPTLTIPFFREQVAAVRTPDAVVIQKLIADLDHAQYRRREAATKALQELGDLAAPYLRDALEKSPEPEARERLEKLIRVEAKTTPEQRRLIRAVEVLERIGTADAVALLTTWSDGARGALLTREATAAKERLKTLATP